MESIIEGTISNNIATFIRTACNMRIKFHATIRDEYIAYRKSLDKNFSSGSFDEKTYTDKMNMFLVANGFPEITETELKYSALTHLIRLIYNRSYQRVYHHHLSEDDLPDLLLQHGELQKKAKSGEISFDSYLNGINEFLESRGYSKVDYNSRPKRTSQNKDKKYPEYKIGDTIRGFKYQGQVPRKRHTFVLLKCSRCGKITSISKARFERLISDNQKSRRPICCEIIESRQKTKKKRANDRYPYLFYRYICGGVSPDEVDSYPPEMDPLAEIQYLLTDRRYIILYDYFINNLPEKAIIEKHGISRQRLSGLRFDLSNYKDLLDDGFFGGPLMLKKGQLTKKKASKTLKVDRPTRKKPQYDGNLSEPQTLINELPSWKKTRKTLKEGQARRNIPPKTLYV